MVVLVSFFCIDEALVVNYALTTFSETIKSTCIEDLIFAQNFTLRITLTVLAFLGLLLSACTKDSTISQPVAIQKEVEYQVSTRRDYSVTWMKDVNVTVRMLVGKISLNDGTGTVLWDSTFSNLTLGQFSLLPNQISIKKSFPIMEDKEKLTVRYSLILAEPLRESRVYLDDVENGVTLVVARIDL